MATLDFGIYIGYQLSALSLEPRTREPANREPVYRGSLSLPPMHELGRSVDHHRHDSGPERHADQERAVGEQQIRWAAAALLPMYQIKVPEDAIQRKRQRQRQLVGAEL